MAEIRSGHPFYMYDAIQAQPAAWTRVAVRARDQARCLAQQITPNRRIYLVGTGTSYHAAQTGENILRAYSGANDVRAVTAFEFALYTPVLAESDVVIIVSHRGTKTYSVKSLEIAQEAGCLPVLITGEGPHAVQTPGLVDYVFVGAPQEDSAAHTVSYTASVSILSVLAQELGFAWHARNALAAGVVEETIPRALESALGVESQMARLAHEYVNHRRIWIVGGGPAAIVATETALKIKETSYLQAEGLATETIIHGPFLAVEADDVFALVAPEGAARERTMTLAGMIREVGAPYFVVADGPDPSYVPPGNGGAWVQVPPVPEPFSTLTTLVPMQLFTYHLALERGRNPDVFRRDDPRFARSGQLVKL